MCLCVSVSVSVCECECVCVCVCVGGGHFYVSKVTKLRIRREALQIMFINLGSG